MLTECFPPSSSATGDLTHHTVGEITSKDGTVPYTVYQTQISKEMDSFGRPSQREQLDFKKDVGLKEKVALLLTELEVRVISSVEAQELSRTMGEALHTLTISSQTKEVSDIQLSGKPLLVFLKEEKTVREAYELLHSLLTSSKPVPKPREKSSNHSVQQCSLFEALRRGIETGNRVLTLKRHNEINYFHEDRQNSVNTTVKTGYSASSNDSQSNQCPRKPGEDIRYSTYKRMDSLEETIRELEKTVIEISGYPTAEQLYSETTAKSTPVQISGDPTPKTKRPPVPPKPSSWSSALIQVHFLHLFCRFML